MLKERVGLLTRLIGQSKGNVQTVEYLTTELHALERDLMDVQEFRHQDRG
jgi:hypothetical protein